MFLASRNESHAKHISLHFTVSLQRQKVLKRNGVPYLGFGINEDDRAGALTTFLTIPDYPYSMVLLPVDHENANAPERNGIL